MPLDRRSLLNRGLGAAALAGLPASLARAAAIPAARRSGTIADVEHIVILMQENRGFDHYFGTMPGVCGFGDRFPIPVPPAPDGTAMTVWDQRDGTTAKPRVIRPFHLATRENFDLMRMKGTPHHWPNAQAAWDHGRMAHWPEAKTERAMAYYTQEDIPFQWAMADAFTLCDAYHCSIQTGTNSNRLYLWTGTNDPHALAGGPAIDNVDDDLTKPESAHPRFWWKTYPERLEGAGVSWGHYQDMADNFGDNPLANFTQYRAAYRGDPGSSAALRDKALTTRTIDQLREDVVHGRLPQVSWIVGTAEGSEHPGPSSPAQGAAYTSQIIDALTADPDVWAKTVLFITFDENDGFFDHVPPPAPPSPDPDVPGGFAGASTVSTDGEYHRIESDWASGDEQIYRGRPYGLGPRVPAYILSPWSRGGWVHSEVCDHTSILRFVETRFGVKEPNISPWRRAVCGDLTGAFDFAHPNRAWTKLPETAEARDRARAIHGQPDPAAPDNGAHPVQATGLRRSRPLGYALEVIDHVDVDKNTIALSFSAQGTIGAVFHVYDRLDLSAIPRRYTVTPGQALTGEWPLAGNDHRYDLWVRGPAGFHRAFTGSREASRQIGTLTWSAANGEFQIAATGGASAFSIEPAAYTQHHQAYTLPAADGSRRWRLKQSGGWYDLIISLPTHPDFRRRLAGRAEGDWLPVTDPAIGTLPS